MQVRRETWTRPTQPVTSTRCAAWPRRRSPARTRQSANEPTTRPPSTRPGRPGRDRRPHPDPHRGPTTRGSGVRGRGCRAGRGPDLDSGRDRAGHRHHQRACPGLPPHPGPVDTRPCRPQSARGVLVADQRRDPPNRVPKARAQPGPAAALSLRPAARLCPLHQPGRGRPGTPPHHHGQLRQLEPLGSQLPPSGAHERNDDGVQQLSPTVMVARTRDMLAAPPPPCSCSILLVRRGGRAGAAVAH
jgi:hypothetical protein